MVGNTSFDGLDLLDHVRFVASTGEPKLLFVCSFMYSLSGDMSIDLLVIVLILDRDISRCVGKYIKLKSSKVHLLFINLFAIKR